MEMNKKKRFKWNERMKRLNEHTDEWSKKKTMQKVLKGI